MFFLADYLILLVVKVVRFLINLERFDTKTHNRAFLFPDQIT